MTTALLKSEIKAFARASVREALSEELVRVRAASLPFVSAREQADIETRYRAPSRRSVRTLRLRA